MGKLYCICAEASDLLCPKCHKNIILKPDQKGNAPAWPRKVGTFLIRSILK